MTNNIKYFESKSFLSPEELIIHRSQDISKVPAFGLKKIKPDGSDIENFELSKLRDEFRKQITVHRIERVSMRSIANWLSNERKVLIVKKEGKFHQYGYTENGRQYLELHEALFLIELNRLEVYFNSVLVSLEQAYQLFLGEGCCREYDKYFVYSTFSRCGYNVQTYKNFDYTYYTTPTVIDCIWEILQKNLDKKYVVSSKLQDNPDFQNIEKSFETIKSEIRDSVTKIPLENEKTKINFNAKIIGKRKADSKNDEYGHSSKKFKQSTTGKSFLSILMNQPEYKRFETFFRKIDIIELYLNNYPDDCIGDDLIIDFDLYLPAVAYGGKSFRKSDPDPPNFRVIIIEAEGKFPNHQIICNCYKKQKFKIPLIVVAVSESKHFQGYLYYFS